MITNLHELLASVESEYPPELTVMAFLRGVRVLDRTLTLTMVLAVYGYFTAAGRNLALIPKELYRKRTAQAIAIAKEQDARNRKNRKLVLNVAARPCFRKSECIPLTRLEGNPRLFEILVLSPFYSGPQSELSVTPEGDTDRPKFPYSRDKACQYCGANIQGKRRGTRFCGATCRQRAHREASR